MCIGILGTGKVGTALGGGWLAAGHDVLYGSRSRRPALHDTELGAAVSDIAHTARRAAIVVLATPFEAALDTIAAAGDLSGKLLIDATNPMGATLPRPHRSGAEMVAAAAGPGAIVVKAFNTMGFETMWDPEVDGRAALGLVAGDHAEAKTTVLQLARDLGFDAVDAGGLDAARMLENLAELWVQLAIRQGHGRGVAFALLRRD